MESLQMFIPILEKLNPIFTGILISIASVIIFVIALKKCGVLDMYFERQDKAKKEYEEKQSKQLEEQHKASQMEKEEFKDEIKGLFKPVEVSISEINKRISDNEKENKAYQEQSKQFRETINSRLAESERLNMEYQKKSFEFHNELLAFTKQSNYNDWLILRERLLYLQRLAIYAKDKDGNFDPHTTKECMVIYNQLFNRYKELVTDPQMLVTDEVILTDDKIRSLDCRDGLLVLFENYKVDNVTKQK